MTEETKRLTEDEFVVQAIKNLRKDPFRGIHSVYSGFNEAFRRHFNKDPVELTTHMVSEGKVEIIPLKSGKGVMLYLPGDGPRGKKADEALQKILE